MEKKAKELKPCPFCGEPGRICEWVSGVFSADCSECGATVDENFSNEEMAAQAWNTRHLSQQEQISDEDIRDVVTSLLHDLYSCGRVWSAWDCGTMTEEDFNIASEDDDIVNDGVEMIRELYYRFQQPTEQKPKDEMSDENCTFPQYKIIGCAFSDKETCDGCEYHRTKPPKDEVDKMKEDRDCAVQAFQDTLAELNELKENQDEVVEALKCIDESVSALARLWDNSNIDNDGLELMSNQLRTIEQALKGGEE